MEDSGALQKFMKPMRKFKQMRRNRKKVNMFVFLPDDILVDILKRLPDAFLRYKVKYVCRQWFDIITGRILLDHASFILHEPVIYKARYVDIREEGQGLEVKEQYLDIPCRGEIKSWCNEYLLMWDPDRYGSIYVFNLITKEGSYLPRCASCLTRRSFCLCGIALSFDRLKGVYKVLSVDVSPLMQCNILIFKNDIISGVSSKWKKIVVPDYMIVGMYSFSHPVSVQGKYFHWKVNFSNFLVSVDSVEEKIFQLHLPRSFGDDKINLYALFEMRGFLTLIGGVTWDKPQIWILKDFQRMDWEKFHSVTLPDHYSTIYSFPSVIHKRYMISKGHRTGNTMCSYDLKYGVVKELNIKIEFGDLCLVNTSSPSFI